MKQARGFGVGVVVASQTQDLDHRALSNAGLWFLGRLQTDAARARVLDGLAAARGTEQTSPQELGTTLQRLAPRWSVVHNAHTTSPHILMQARDAMSLMRRPMTHSEIRRARGVRKPARAETMGTTRLAVDTPVATRGKEGELLRPFVAEQGPVSVAVPNRVIPVRSAGRSQNSAPIWAS